MVGSKCRDFKNREVSNVNTPKIDSFLQHDAQINHSDEQFLSNNR